VVVVGGCVVVVGGGVVVVGGGVVVVDGGVVVVGASVGVVGAWVAGIGGIGIDGIGIDGILNLKRLPQASPGEIKYASSAKASNEQIIFAIVSLKEMLRKNNH